MRRHSAYAGEVHHHRKRDGKRTKVISSKTHKFILQKYGIKHIEERRKMILYRPVGEKEKELIEESDYTKFPPRLDWQPIVSTMNCNPMVA